MRNVIRYNRPRSMSLFPEVDDFFRSFGNLYSTTAREVPLEMYEEGEELIVNLDAPGIEPKDVEIRVFSDRVAIRAKSESEESVEDSGNRTYHCSKRRSSFNYNVALPVEVDADRAEASFDKGVISLRLTKRQKDDGHVIRFDS